MVFSIVFERVFPFLDSMSYTKLLVLIYLVLLSLNQNFYTTLLQVNKIVVFLLIVFFFTNVVNLNTLAIQHIENFNFTFLFNVLFLWVLLTHEKLNPGVLNSSLPFFVIGYMFLVFLTFFGYYDSLSNGRIYIGGSLPNNLAFNGLYVLGFFLLFLSGFRVKSFLLKSLIAFIVISIIILILNTGSRSAFLSLLIMFVVFLVFNKKKLILLSILITISFIFYENFSVIIERLNSTFLSGEIGGRWKIINFSLDLISSNFIFGVGPDQFDLLSEAKFGYSPSPHNVFLEVYLYGGLIAFALTVCIFYKLIKYTYKSYRLNGNYFYLILVPPFVIQALSGQVFNNKIIFFLFAIIISSQSNYKKENIF